jgi:class 3 adenylate cyclase
MMVAASSVALSVISDTPAGSAIRWGAVEAGGEIFGDVANIAARAQALADPGAVVVTRGYSAKSLGCRRRGARQP